MSRKVLRWLIPAAVIALDQATKAASAGMTGAMTLIPGLLGLRYTQNTGIAFSLLSGQSWPLGLLTLAVLAAGAAALRRYRLGWMPWLGALLVLGGGVSNAIDRILRGYVPDMIEILAFRFAVFNAADVCVCAGALLCALSLLFRPADWRERRRE